MEDQNIIIFLDKVKKLIELGNKPKAVTEIESIMEILQKQINLKKGKVIIPITIPEPTDTEKANPIFLRDYELAGKINEIINLINQRWSA